LGPHKKDYTPIVYSCVNLLSTGLKNLFLLGVGDLNPLFFGTLGGSNIWKGGHTPQDSKGPPKLYPGASKGFQKVPFCVPGALKEPFSG